MMKRCILVVFLLLHAVWAAPAQTNNRVIVQTTGGLPLVQILCATLGCNVQGGLDGALGQVFLVTTPASTDLGTFLNSLLSQVGVVAAEPDQIATASDTGYAVPSALYDSTPVNYFGSTVPHGYVFQPATQIIRLSTTQSTFGVQGSGTVAVIDTGVDPNHPTLQNALVPGYDFVHNQPNADETLDINLPAQPTPGNSQAAWVNQSTAAVVDQSTAAVVDGNSQYGDFGHGTMVAGVIHLVAPGAKIMPLKAFQSNGTGYSSDIIRAIYWATQHNAKIINMSFSLSTYSSAMQTAINLASLQGVICVAAAGNDGANKLVYPAAFNNVMGVASTTNADQRSAFSNYGNNLVWVAAPGEGVVTTYPYGAYAAAWGTSFSTPFVSGVAALMLDVRPSLLQALLVALNQSQSASSLSHAQPVGQGLGNGRLDAYQAVLSWSQSMGLLLGIL